MNIEHIAPQGKPEKQGLSHEDVAAIGNLLLVDGKLNTELGSKSFLDKILILKKSEVQLDPILIKAKNWGKEEISRRTEWMAKIGYQEIWAI